MLRADLAEPVEAPAVEPLLTVAHLSDLHVCDHQSPARIEFLDRWADPDSPILEHLGEVGTYRAQELMTAQVVDACVRAVNAVERGPVFGAASRPRDRHRRQHRQLPGQRAGLVPRAARRRPGPAGLGRPVPRTRASPTTSVADERFWHPSSARAGPSRARRTASRRCPACSMRSASRSTRPDCDMPWLAVHGNHDQLLQGTVPGTGPLAAVAVGNRKAYDLPDGWTPEDALELLAGLAACDPSRSRVSWGRRMRDVTPTRPAASHPQGVRRPAPGGRRPAGRATASGLATRPTTGTTSAGCSLLVLDTVDEYGGWEGSLDRPQLDWLAAELTAGRRGAALRRAGQPSPARDDGQRHRGPDRVLGAEVQALVTWHPCVVLWLAGHTHELQPPRATPKQYVWFQ